MPAASHASIPATSQSPPSRRESRWALHERGETQGWWWSLLYGPTFPDVASHAQSTTAL